VNEQRVSEHAKRSYMAKETVRVARKLLFLSLVRLNSPKLFSRTLPEVNRLLRSLRTHQGTIVEFLNQHPGVVDSLDSITLSQSLDASNLLVGFNTIRDTLVRGYRGKRYRGIETHFSQPAKFLYTVFTHGRKNLLSIPYVQARELLFVQICSVLTYRLIRGRATLIGNWQRIAGVIDRRLFRFLDAEYLKAFVKRQLGEYYVRLNQLMGSLVIDRLPKFYKPLRKTFLSKWFGLDELRKFRRKSKRGSYQGSILLDHLRIPKRASVIVDDYDYHDDYSYGSSDIGEDKIVERPAYYYSSDSDYW
jgi:hypothetical protein